MKQHQRMMIMKDLTKKNKVKRKKGRLKQMVGF